MIKMDKYEALSHYFGYFQFRPGQERIINAILDGKDVLAVMPTGGGKSICFQLPALLKDGVAIVISPLISLMKDQVNALVQNGIDAVYVNSSLTDNQVRNVLRNISDGKYKIVYVAPERLLTSSFLSAVSSIDISLVCIDEAHCVSQWGHDFRVSYLHIKDFINYLDKRPTVCAFTATATQRVRDDIENLLGLYQPEKTVLSFDRKNLFFSVLTPKNKMNELRRLLALYENKSGIIYCSSRKRTDAIYDRLSQEGYSIAKYHAGMSPDERKINQDLFSVDDRRIIVATNAFGMGIDKSNVSFVIHYNMPGDIESYYQEAGRAGRDGSRADCVLLFGKSDIRTQRYFIDFPEPNPDISLSEAERLRKNRIEKLNAMIGYAQAKGCLRKYILNYFGESAERKCGMCSVCEENSRLSELTVKSQMILSCIARVNQTLTAEKIADILLGNLTQSVKENGYDKLSTFALMKNSSLGSITELIKLLEENEYISQSNGILKLNRKCREVLFENKDVSFKNRSVQKKSKRSKTEAVESEEYDTQLFERLRLLRKKLAAQKNVPPFVIFADTALKCMAQTIPTTGSEFMKIPGVGAKKYSDYSAVFIKEINAYLAEKEGTV